MMSEHTHLDALAAVALERGRDHLRSMQHESGYWKAELQTNVTMDAEDLLMREFLGIRDETIVRQAATWIRSQQFGLPQRQAMQVPQFRYGSTTQRSPAASPNRLGPTWTISTPDSMTSSPIATPLSRASCIAVLTTSSEWPKRPAEYSPTKSM